MCKIFFNILILVSLSCILTRDVQLLAVNLKDKLEYCENEERNTKETDQKSSEEKDSEQQENNLWSFQYRLTIPNSVLIFQNRLAFAVNAKFWGQPYLAVFSLPPEAGLITVSSSLGINSVI